MASATPARLLCRRGGRWALEVTRLIAVDNHIFQPRSQRVEGSEAILQQLKRSVDSGLAQSAAQLMRSVRSDEERSFDAVDGEWVPVMSNGSNDSVNEALQHTSALELALAELRAEVLMLRASHQRLRRRVEALEARAENLEPAAPRRGVERAVLAPASFAQARAPESEARPAALITGTFPGEHQPTLMNGRAPDSGDAPPLGQVVARGDQSAAAAKIAPSTAAQVLQALSELYGGDSGFQSSKEGLPDSALELVALYASQLLDDDGAAVGAVLADIRATANLGGRLAQLPQTVIDEQAKTGLLNDTVTSAMSEVCNTLTNLLSRVEGNRTIRSSPLESFPVDRLGWVRSATHLLPFSKPRGGTFWLAIR